MTDAGPQDQIDDNENDQESVSLPGVLHGKPAMGEGGGRAPTKLFNMWSFVLLFVVVLWWPLAKLSSNIYLCEEALGLKIVLVQIISVNGQ